ncbi:hypothetical protein H4R24_003678 [Coemansia sp. RSA 988]|nr:hypothetical protein H4R24_003678 [Coemansia sp. RSA 988]
MDFGNILKQAKGAYDQYQEQNSKNTGNDGHQEGAHQQGGYQQGGYQQGDGHQQGGYQQGRYQQGDGYQQGNGPMASHYQGQPQQQQQQQEYGDNERQHESGGFDIGKMASMASGFLGNKNESSGHTSSSGGGGGGLDFGQIATMASGFLGNKQGSSGSGGGQSDMISSVLKMAMGGGGFNKGHDASHDDMKSSYHSVLGGGSDGLAGQGQQAMGLAAAYMAFQQYQQEGGHSSGGGQNKLPSMAIAQAKKLFDQHSSKGGQANEKETLATAAQAAMKLFNSK